MLDCEVIFDMRCLQDPSYKDRGVGKLSSNLVRNGGNFRNKIKTSTRGLIEQYVTYFDIRPDGLDILKYALAFGMALSLYFKRDGERHVLSALARMRTLRVMRSAASATRPDQAAPAKVMVEKLQKIWKEEEHERLTGLYGTYMLFKTWSLPGEIGGIPAQEKDDGQPDRAPAAQRTQRLKWFSHPRATSAASGAMRANISVS